MTDEIKVVTTWERKIDKHMARPVDRLGKELKAAALYHGGFFMLFGSNLFKKKLDQQR
ncbi:MAG: hypothetical protein HY889_00350 [Deltaproteobacteria bacterium]|nr:hypothetical protein [Deltaproteobacteria bacterium]